MADIAIIGAGHNGLVTACYLAKEGHRVAVFEKRTQVGGCAITDEKTFPGFKVSTLSYVNSLFSPLIVDELGLREYGYKVLPRNPASFTPTPSRSDGYLLLSHDEGFNRREISKFSKRDAVRYIEYERALDRVARFITKTLNITPPNNTFEAIKLVKLIPDALKTIPGGAWNFAKLMGFWGLWNYDARDFLDDWFESDILKATLLTDATIGAVDFSGHVLLHHVMGEAGGARGVWGYQEGGMGGLTKALSMVAEKLGVEIYTETGIARIKINKNKASGVFTDEGLFYPADCVISNADPYLTFIKMAGAANLPSSFLSGIKKINFSSATTKINLALNGLPDFYCKPNTSVEPEEQHIGSIHISPSVEYIVQAAEYNSAGHPSPSPMMEITIPSTVDKSLAPPGYHVMGIFVQFTPRHLLHTYDLWDIFKYEYFNTRILPTLRGFITNIDDIVMDYQVISPLDLEREYSLTGGNIFHGAMTPGQLFNKRPLAGYSNYRTPIEGLYMCGAGTHPGGGVMGTCGYNAAREVIKDLKKNR